MSTAGVVDADDGHMQLQDEGTSSRGEAAEEQRIQPMELERLQKLSEESARDLHMVWAEMGLSAEERSRQLATLVEAVEQVFIQKVADEVALRDEYVSAAQTLETEIDEISAELGVKRSHFTGKTHGTLMLRLTWLRSHLVQFKAVREERMQHLKEVQNALREIHSELGTELPMELETLEGFLTEEGTAEVEARLAALKGDRMRRIGKIQDLVRDIVALFDDLEMEPDSELDMAIASGGHALGIDSNAVAVLEDRVQQLTEEKQARTEKLKRLGASIQPLWEKLGISQEDRQAFFNNNRGLGLQVINQCETELQRLLELKQASMGDLIRKAQEQLTALWDEMHYSDEQREAFTQQHMLGRICEETLEAHEEEVRVLQIQAELYRPLLELVDKYNVLLQEREDYEAKIKDSSRLLSRRGGSALRDEELQRQRVTKGLPKLMDKISEVVTEYEKEHGPFLLKGERFLDTMARIEGEHEAVLEEEKLAKQKAKHTNKEDTNTVNPANSNKGTLKKGQLAAAKQRTPLMPKND